MWRRVENFLVESFARKIHGDDGRVLVHARAHGPVFWGGCPRLVVTSGDAALEHDDVSVRRFELLQDCLAPGVACVPKEGREHVQYAPIDDAEAADMRQQRVDDIGVVFNASITTVTNSVSIGIGVMITPRLPSEDARRACERSSAAMDGP